MKPLSAATDPAVQALQGRLTGRPWQVLRTGPADGATNMARDLELLEAAAAERLPPTLRFYTWSPPAVSLGRFQPEEGIDRDYRAARGWDLVRRPTGGRAVLHHLELTYSLVLPPSLVAGAGVRTSYAVLSRGLNAGLATLLGRIPCPNEAGACDVPVSTQKISGSCTAEETFVRSCTAPKGITNCFALASECDTLVPGGKLVGSAQVRHHGALLQHGSILLDAEPEAWTALFGTAGRLVTLRELLGAVPAQEVVERAVVAGFRSLGIPLES